MGIVPRVKRSEAEGNFLQIYYYYFVLLFEEIALEIKQTFMYTVPERKCG